MVGWSNKLVTLFAEVTQCRSYNNHAPDPRYGARHPLLAPHYALHWMQSGRVYNNCICRVNVVFL